MGIGTEQLWNIAKYMPTKKLASGGGLSVRFVNRFLNPS
jgi:hypothetical protein